jgi:hypothetical protein
VEPDPRSGRRLHLDTSLTGQKRILMTGANRSNLLFNAHGRFARLPACIPQGRVPGWIIDQFLKGEDEAQRQAAAFATRSAAENSDGEPTSRPGPSWMTTHDAVESAVDAPSDEPPKGLRPGAKVAPPRRPELTATIRPLGVAAFR